MTVASVLDRLLDPRTGLGSDRVETPLRVRIDALQRDLSALLNTRRPWRTLPATMTMLELTLPGYGLGDFAADAFGDAPRRERLRQDIAQAIGRFEPRLHAVHVTLLDRSDSFSATLRIRIAAELRDGAVPEQVEFNTRLDLRGTTPVTVTEARHE